MSEVSLKLTLTNSRCSRKPFLIGSECGHRLVKVSFSPAAVEALKRVNPQKTFGESTVCLKPGLCAASGMSQILEVLELLK